MIETFADVQKAFARIRFRQPGFRLEIREMDPLLKRFYEPGPEAVPADEAFMLIVTVTTYDTYSYVEPEPNKDPIMVPTIWESDGRRTMRRDDYERDRLNSKIEIQHRRIMPLPMREDGFPHVIRHAIHAVVMHEADEWLLVDGEMMFDPHRGERR